VTTATDRPATRSWTLTAGLVATGLLAAAAVLPLPQGHRLEAGMLLGFAAFASVGAVVLGHRRGHPVGRIMLAIGLLGLLTAAVQNYGYHAVHAQGQAPGTGLATWFGEVPWVLIGALLVVFVLVFPTGAALSPRWVWVVRLQLFAGVMGAVAAALVLWPLRGPQILDLVDFPEGPLAFFLSLGFVLIGLSFPVAVVCLVLRFRRATGIERAVASVERHMTVPAAAALLTRPERRVIIARLAIQTCQGGHHGQRYRAQDRSCVRATPQP
jgi:hypothetical protein